MTFHAVTVDLEDWHQLMTRRVTGALGAPSPRSPEATRRLLDLLDAQSVKSTFFVLGLFAESFPDIVQEVARRGHEIASHSQTHRVIHALAPDDVRRELEYSRKLLQDLTGQPVVGFRAPEFSLPALDHWAFELLIECGFQYDSSIFPGAARYGIAGAPRTSFTIRTSAGVIQEFPLATWRLGSRNFPVAGGTYFRFVPLAVLKRAIAHYEQCNETAVLYFHPYEFSRGFLYLDGLALDSMLRPEYLKYLALHNVASGRVAARLQPLLKDFRFLPLGEINVNRIGT